MTATLLICLALLAVDPASAPAAEAAMPQAVGRITTAVTTEYALNYLVSVPEDYDASGEPLPLLLFLHGAGERGDDLEKVKRHGPPMKNGTRSRSCRRPGRRRPRRSRFGPSSVAKLTKKAPPGRLLE